MRRRGKAILLRNIWNLKLPHLAKYERCHELKIQCVPLADSNFKSVSLNTFSSHQQQWNLCPTGHCEGMMDCERVWQLKDPDPTKECFSYCDRTVNSLGYQGIWCPCIEFTEITKATAKEWDLVEMFFWRGTRFWFTVLSALLRVSSAFSSFGTSMSTLRTGRSFHEFP